MPNSLDVSSVERSIDDCLNELWLLPADQASGAYKTRLYTRIRTLRMKLAVARGSHTKEQWHELQERHAYRCAQCGLVPKRALTKDHIVPVSRGGSDAIANIRPLCQPCNSRKGAK
jgi:5-methylcytosine-specific restriction endonuclease McrA